MSTKAKLAAITAYPGERFIGDSYCEMCRGFYQEGYEQAEADLLELIGRLRKDLKKRDLNDAANAGYNIALDAVELLIKEGQR